TLPPTIVVSGDMPTPVVTVTGSGTVDAVVAAVTAQAGTPTLTAAGRVTAAAATASASANTPVIGGGATITAVKATGTAAAGVPVVSSALIPMGLTLEDSFFANTWAEIPAATWFATWASYPLTVDSGNGLQVSGGGLARVTISNQTSSSAGFGRYVRLVKNGSTTLHESSSTASTNPYTVVVDNVSLTDGDVLTLWVQATGTITSQRTMVAGTRFHIEPMP
ncbi:hypothetical protein, partial [Rhodococcus jostii]|uniref:hypothetical protein n=2 Tax=Rhodococcus jostii TaxID=132919 RepID=UPI00362AF4D2